MRWYLTAVLVAAAGALAALVLGSVLGLVTGLLLVATVQTVVGGRGDHIYGITLAIGPVVCAMATAGVGATISWQPVTSRIPTVIALGVVSAIGTFMVLIGRPAGDWGFILNPREVGAYLLGVGVSARAVGRAWTYFQRPQT